MCENRFFTINQTATDVFLLSLSQGIPPNHMHTVFGCEADVNLNQHYVYGEYTFSNCGYLLFVVWLC